jgi:hypothetical protein
MVVAHAASHQTTELESLSVKETEERMKVAIRKLHVLMVNKTKEREGMELVQVAILVAIAILIGLIFRTQIKTFVDDVFKNLTAGKFS